MSETWFYARGNQQNGPVPLDDRDCLFPFAGGDYHKAVELQFCLDQPDDRRLVVDHQDEPFSHAFSPTDSRMTGKLMVKVEPLPGPAELARMLPPWASISIRLK